MSTGAPRAHCSRCDALCCQLTVVVFREDGIPRHLTTTSEHGVTTMARDPDGWCVALDGARMNCSIYDTRPGICRKFAMAGPSCLDVRAEAGKTARAIPMHVLA